jgi:glutamate N-acetyltransferase / amino-acid N-acetyltransferase
MKHPVSPLAPDRFPDMPRVAGVRLATAATGIKYSGRADVLVAELAPATTVGGVLTRSATAAAPVDWCRQALIGGSGRALVVNSGNANAFTGGVGVEAVRITAETTAEVLSCPPNDVFIASTGVIGEPLPTERIVSHLKGLRDDLGTADWAAAAAAIMTTDTFPKGASRQATIDSTLVNIVGITKGSGMIAPDMATMLAFIFTDALIPAPVLQKAVAAGADKSFNRITVDSDTSTSDTVLTFATGAAGNPAITAAGDARLRGFRKALTEVMVDLAQQIVRDGEGASKFVTITVGGAISKKAARRIALSIANSPLVKTAIAGEDANWGRIVAAVGKAGEKADRDRLAITVGGIPVAEFGSGVVGYDETPVARHMKGQEIDIEVDVGVGRSRATVWTCDLTHGYIDINADYRS